MTDTDDERDVMGEELTLDDFAVELRATIDGFLVALKEAVEAGDIPAKATREDWGEHFDAFLFAGQDEEDE